MYPVEHKYIDFKMLVLREKCRFIASMNSERQVNHDETFSEMVERVDEGTVDSLGLSENVLSELMMQRSDDVDFYLLESIQKLIDFQF